MSEQKEKFHLPGRSLSLEFWVGVFSIFGVGCFAYLAINIANIRLSNTGFYQVKAEFDNVSGLKTGAAVEIAGVEVGQVTDIVLTATAATITMQIQNAVPLRVDDVAAIRTKGIIGDRYVKVVPGGAQDLVPAGGKLAQTESAMEFEEIIGKFIHQMES